MFTNSQQLLPVGWGCRIHQLQLCRAVRPSPPNKCPGYDTKKSVDVVPVMLKLWGMQSTPSLPSLPGSLWQFLVAMTCLWVSHCKLSKFLCVKSGKPWLINQATVKKILVYRTNEQLWIMRHVTVVGITFRHQFLRNFSHQYVWCLLNLPQVNIITHT